LGTSGTLGRRERASAAMVSAASAVPAVRVGVVVLVAVAVVLAVAVALALAVVLVAAVAPAVVTRRLVTMSLDYIDRLGQVLAARLVVRLGIDAAPTADEVTKALYEAIIDVFGDRGAEPHANRPSLAVASNAEAWFSGNLSLPSPTRSIPDRMERQS
jgi:hypothetical protein